MLQNPDRALRLSGATNFRDLGGYAGHGGRPLRWRRLFRSDHLGSLSDADRALLSELGLSRSFDFRGVDERAASSYHVPGLDQHSLAIEPTVVQRMQELAAAGHVLSAPVMVELMKDLYRSMVNDHAHCFAELFEHLLQLDVPLVFHCTAGKDRTGIAAALILLALGVPRDVVMQDYLLSNELYRPPPVPASDIPSAALAVLRRVQQGFLGAALQVIDTDHGGAQAYLGRRLGLTAAALDALAARYLLPA